MNTPDDPTGPLCGHQTITGTTHWVCVRPVHDGDRNNDAYRRRRGQTHRSDQHVYVRSTR